jgi:GTP pyrophosphokinase
VLVPDKPKCYESMGVLHDLYKPIPGKFKDYVAIPKANGYQSLHTTLFGPFGTPLEAQIRTHDMHRVAEAGVAPHWLYKSGGAIDLAEAQRETTKWLQSLLEIQSESRDSKEFLEHVKGDLFPEEIYVFTPKGKIMALPRGATAVDFAYGVHTDIGHHCVAARINYELLPLRTELRTATRQITAAPTARPTHRGSRSSDRQRRARASGAFPEGHHSGRSQRLGERLLAQARSHLKVDPSRSAGTLGGFARSTAQKPARHPRRRRLGRRLSFVSRRRTRVGAGRGRETRPPRRGCGPHAAGRRGRRDHTRNAAARFPATRSSPSSARARA